MAKTADQKRTLHFSRVTVRKQIEEIWDVPQEITFETEDGTEFTWPHPMFYTDELQDELKELDDEDTKGIAETLLGDQWSDFLEHGGSASDVMQVMAVVQRQMQDTTPDGRPTRR
jgi:hypothetical protein